MNDVPSHITTLRTIYSCLPREFMAARVEITRTLEGVLFNDAGTFPVKYFRQDGTVEVIAANGFEGNNEGRAEDSSFGQTIGICTENSNVFVTHSQTECVKLIATISGTVIFFKQLAKLYRAFSIHLKHQKATRLPVTEAIKEFSDFKRFLEGTFSTVKESLKTTPRKLSMAPRGQCQIRP